MGYVAGRSRLFVFVFVWGGFRGFYFFYFFLLVYLLSRSVSPPVCLYMHSFADRFIWGMLIKCNQNRTLEVLIVVCVTSCLMLSMNPSCLSTS